MRGPLSHLALLALSIALAACSDPPPLPAPGPVDATVDNASPSTATSADPWNFAGAPVEGTRITASPNPVDFCTEKLQVVEVEWDLATAEAHSPQIWVQEAGGKRQLWAALKEPVGDKRTGSWARSGMQFVAIDGRTMDVINSVTIEAKPCP